MDGFFDKINTLINAQLNDLLGRNPKSPLARIKLDTANPDENPRRTVKSIQQRMDEALDYEDVLQAKVQKIMQEAVDLDEQADALVKAGDEFGARRMLQQLQMKQQQLNIAEAELREHRLLTQHLIQELSTLEMALDNQERQKKQEQSTSSSRGGATRIPISGDEQSDSYDVVNLTPVGGDKSLKDTVSDRINETRSSLENLLKNSPVPKPEEISNRFGKYEIVDEEPDPRKPSRPAPKKGDDDMGDRLSRLSKPDDD